MNDAEGRIIERDRTPWVNRVTHDAIQHFAWGIGDDNPRWIAPGRQIAPPCFLYAVDETTVAPGLDDHRRIYRSVEWTWFDRAPAGTELAATATLIDESTTPSGELEQLGRVDFHNADGELIASAQTRCVRTRAPEPAVGDRPELRYRAEELDQIETTILRERRQGATPRYWEDVAVGDRFGPLLKGPLSIMDVVAWCAGTQGVAGDAFGLSEGGLHSETATGPQRSHGSAS